MNENIIINGESIQEMSRLEAQSIDLIFADPPYFMQTSGILHRVEGTEFNGCQDYWDKFDSLEDYKNFTRQWLTQCKRLLKHNASIWVIGSMQCIYIIGSVMQELGFWIINDVIWHKTNPTPNFMGTRLNNSHETLIWAVPDKSSRYTFHYKTAKALFTENAGRQMGSVWRIPVCSGNERLKDSHGKKIHSTQKPLLLLERVIAISSNLNDVILDPFAGTMTAGAAAKKLGRRYIMIEADKNYCITGEERLANIEFIDSPEARAVYDIKPLRVKIQEMIQAKAFITGESFYLPDGQERAKLLEDGKILLDNQVTDIHSGAARAKNLKAKRVNGFDVWHVMRNNKLVSINTIRENYRSSQEVNFS